MWNFDTGDPTQTEPIGADETYMPNSPNAWSILSVDPPDQWGGERTPQTERFSSSVIALDLEIGQLRWTFQTVHHDLWDMDVPSQPQLEDVQREGETVPAVVQATKQGDIYVRDRRTGEPLLPVTEEQAPTGAAEGDFTAPAQPTSALSFKPDMLRERDMWGVTMFDQLYCRIQFRSMNYEGRYTPPSVRAPSSIPAISASSTGVARRSIPFGRIVLANPVYLAFTVKLIPRADDKTNYVSEGEPGFNENDGAPSAAAMRPFYSVLGLPCQAPPWGYAAAADLETGKIIWRHKNGTVRDLAPVPLPFKLGVPALGGPRGHRGRPDVPQRNARLLVRAFDSETGEELWRDRRPAGAQATPMTYRGEDGRQYLVVVADGHGSTGTKAGDHVIAYALPPG